MDPELLRQTSGGDYLFAYAWALVLGTTLLVWTVTREERRALLLLWLAKVGVTLGVMLAYEANYGLDSYIYFLNGVLSPWSLSDVHFGNGTEAMKFFASVHEAALPTSYHAEKVTCAFLGLVAIYQLYAAARLMWPALGVRSLYVLGLFPSVLFWTSILGKDPLVLVGIALFVRAVVTWHLRGGVAPLIYGAAGVVFASVFRTWMAPILVAPLGVFVFLRARSWSARIIFSLLVLVATLASFRFFFQMINAESSTDVIGYSNQVAHSWQEGGSGQINDVEFTGPVALLGFLPLGMFTALFRPLPGEFFTPFALVASLENGAILWLLARAGRRFRAADLREPLVVWALAFVLFWSAVYSVASYQNLGTAVRFRLQILPMLLGLLLYLGRPVGAVWTEVEDDDGEDEGERLEDAGLEASAVWART